MGGTAVSLLSGGIDSPVSSYMIAKRGVQLEMVHFFSPPYTSQQALDKVVQLAERARVAATMPNTCRQAAKAPSRSQSSFWGST